MERKLETLQQRIVEISEDKFGLQAAKLERMFLMHAKKDFKDGIRVYPEDLVSPEKKKNRPK